MQPVLRRRVDLAGEDETREIESGPNGGGTLNKEADYEREYRDALKESHWQHEEYLVLYGEGTPPPLPEVHPVSPDEGTQEK